MADSYEYVRVEALDLTPSQIVWRRYKRPAPEMLAEFLDLNAHIAPYLGESPFLPINVIVAIPIDRRALAGKPTLKPRAANAQVLFRP